jgi:hypothetical protein
MLYLYKKIQKSCSCVKYIFLSVGISWSQSQLSSPVHSNVTSVILVAFPICIKMPTTCTCTPNLGVTYEEKKSHPWTEVEMADSSRGSMSPCYHSNGCTRRQRKSAWYSSEGGRCDRQAGCLLDAPCVTWLTEMVQTTVSGSGSLRRVWVKIEETATDTHTGLG